MTRITLAAVVLTAVILTAGCASTTTRSSETSKVNTAYMGAVERHARRANVRVVWVNPPRERRRSEEQNRTQH
jgi:uncharacterized protein YceK